MRSGVLCIRRFISAASLARVASFRARRSVSLMSCVGYAGPGPRRDDFAGWTLSSRAGVCSSGFRDIVAIMHVSSIRYPLQMIGGETEISVIQRGRFTTNKIKYFAEVMCGRGRQRRGHTRKRHLWQPTGRKLLTRF